jgi:hypothetical protein
MNCGGPPNHALPRTPSDRGRPQVNHDTAHGWTPLVHAIDIQSDSADQAGLSLDEVPTALTELLLAFGAVVTTRVIEVASGYGNPKALAMLSRAKHA